MYICLCNQVTDSEIKQALQAGCDSLVMLQQTLNVSTRCGACVDEVLRLIEEEDTAPQIATTYVNKKGFTVGLCYPRACF